jgi:hypothetical protein
MTIATPVHAGDEMRALARFHRDVTWTGTIQAGRGATRCRVHGGPFTLVERYECHTMREPAPW